MENIKYLFYTHILQELWLFAPTRSNIVILLLSLLEYNL